MNLLKFLFGILLAIGGCAFCYWIVMLNLMVSLTADQLTKAGFPYFGQKVTEWQLGVPMDTYSEQPIAGWAVPRFRSGKVKPKGYVGLLSFYCGTPTQYGYVSSPFGPRDGHIHTGIDFGTYRIHQDVYAPMGGQVIYAGWSDVGYGNLIVIENGGVLLYLGHFDSFALDLEEGDIVTAGDIVGVSGTTGNSSGIHVHVEYRFVNEDGTTTPFDPTLNNVPGQTEFCNYYGFAYDQGIDDELHGLNQEP